MSKPKSEIVRKGYSKIAKAYHKQRDKYNNNLLLTKISKRFPKGSTILDLGSGTGVPIAKFLVNKGYDIIGIDFAENMIKLARKNVPRAKFIKMDITKMKFKPNSFDGAVSFYAIIHIPREKHACVYKKLHRILRPNSHMFLNASGYDVNGWEGYGKDYLGVPMFWSYYGPKKTSRLIVNAGFEIIWSKVLKLGGDKQFWVLAKKND
ncbi:methyltransferase domain-containing protein [Candidatus Micrarchaeota archaeon]|nr:methyltransferase domain-containing protein [Candidatus Micrarchaeota archaeon]